MYCQNCGAEVTGPFCGKCGAAAGSPAPGAPGAGQAAAGDGLTTNAASALCYVLGLITGLLFLNMAPHNQNPVIRFHAWQSILFNVACIAIFILEAIINIILPWVLVAMVSLFGMLLGLGLLLVWLFLIWKAYQGEQFSLPVIGDMAKQKAGM